MNIIKNISIIILIQFFFSVNIHGQFKSRISLEIKDITYNRGNLIVKYDIHNSKQKDKIRVWFNVFNSKNDTIFAKTWKGDANKFIDGGMNKLAIWDVSKDGIDITDSISIKISASIQNGVYLDNPFILSTIFPGWGDYQIKQRKPYWIYGAMAYSFVGASVYFNNSAANNYYTYESGKTSSSDKDLYFNKAKSENILSYAFIGAAGAIWLIDYIGLIKRTRQIKKNWEKNYPIKETPNIPNFKIVTSISPNVFINTSLTNLQLVKNSLLYIDKDENACLDAFEEGFITFKLKNLGPANASNFYAQIETSDTSGNIELPQQIKIDNIPIYQSKLIKIPVKAGKNIKSGVLEFSINVTAKQNNSVPEFKIKVNTCKFHYKPVNRQMLISDIDKNIPVIKTPDKRKYALIIGNEGYANAVTGLSKNFNVPYARNDALTFNDYAIKMLGVPEKNITLLIDANKKDMYESILTLSKQVSKIKDKAQLIFYYAGHGLSDTITKAPYLIPVDIPPSKISDAISMEFLYKKIWESRSSKSLVVIDASFNNGGRQIGLRGPSAKILNPRKEVISGNTIVFMAISEKNTSNLYTDKKHGLFTYYFLKILKESKGTMNLLTLSNSIKTNVSLKANELGHDQVPITLVSIAIRDIWQDWKVQ